MGQKIRPDSFRFGITKSWNARWFPKKHFSFKDQLEEDVTIRKVIQEKIMNAGIVKVEIERGAHTLYRILIKAARPGFVIGRGGKGIEELNGLLEKRLRELLRTRGVTNPKISLSISIEELKRSEISAAYLAQLIAWDLEKRLPARRTLKKYLQEAMQNKDVKGAKIKLSGRMDGGEIARREWLSRGSLPLQTLRADIDYGEATSFASYGTVGIKVWLYKGEIFPEEDEKERKRR